ncbi:Methyltransferase domain [Rubrobacter radiotolerans]|uniref:Methyltransferase domain n=1 Tax=Rubrobacter radiotolerans TaxID=42256 RepID=A0A023X7G9_RUBRA|nr:Methyltransferase domain [Rubrobacter radiotolerans]SMC07998.1 Methyltransferase domain-containing protein [Rubrobacter radiotolerans DSM 5868]
MRENAVGDHYGRGDLWKRIRAALLANGLDPNNLEVEDLAPVDQFHSRGRSATLDLARLAGLTSKMRVLDLGGGLGGPARVLASEVGCSVEVLDLTREFCRVGERLTAATGLSDLVSFRHGNALDLPYGDSSFDVVWTQHSAMNISDKERLYREVRRVLLPGGHLAMHEVFAAPDTEVRFPVPWAREPGISHLLPQTSVRAILAASGLQELAWLDESSAAEKWFRKRAASMPPSPDSPPSLTLSLVLGPDFVRMFRNQLRNLEEGRISIARGLFKAV